ncbi:hypothetical protein sS8_1560 [Methylocaldum marinum]|uniref:Uncharacterized protein n=1 Tax=Methylocaldum marinum TaxID=1432792 RepID=A0A250KPJ6_9GAMM|nr:hypothetical protein sS8_1560 [Methylocaldum marinum]
MRDEPHRSRGLPVYKFIFAHRRELEIPENRKDKRRGAITPRPAPWFRLFRPAAGWRYIAG